MNPQNLTLEQAKQRLEDLETYAANSVEAYESVAEDIEELTRLVEYLAEIEGYTPEEDTVEFEAIEPLEE